MYEDDDPYDEYNISEDDTYKSSSKYSDDGDLQEKIKQTSKTIKHLRNCLAVAKDHLEMERIQSQTLLCGYPSSSNMNILYSHPYMPPYCHYSNYDLYSPYYGYPNYDDAYPDTRNYSNHYIDQLNDVHKKCNEELNKMHESMCDLRKIKRYWELYEPRNSFSTPRYYKETYPLEHKERRQHAAETSTYDENSVISNNSDECPI